MSYELAFTLCREIDPELEAVNYYHKALHLGCCSSPRSTAVTE